MRGDDKQIFRAMKWDQLEQMKNQWLQEYDKAKSDDFYAAAVEAKRRGHNRFTLDKSFISAKASSDDPINCDVLPALGSVHLRHAAVSQPLVPLDSADVDFCLPFERNSQIIEEFWNFLLQLEDLTRQEGNRQRINDVFRYIFLTLQLHAPTDASGLVDASRHHRLAFCLGDPKGQAFLVRFVEIIPSSSALKMFFFVSFAVCHDAAIDPESQFAGFFLGKLTRFLLDGVKPKWIAACLRQIAARGFAVLATDRFRSACLAALVRMAAVAVKRADDDAASVLRAAMEALADKVVIELRDVIHEAYSGLFMQVVVRSLVAVVPASPLKVALTAVSI
jgi:hypothetical protein